MSAMSETNEVSPATDGSGLERLVSGRRVGCAAVRAEDGELMLSIRHYSRDSLEHLQRAHQCVTEQQIIININRLRHWHSLPNTGKYRGGGRKRWEKNLYFVNQFGYLEIEHSIIVCRDSCAM